VGTRNATAPNVIHALDPATGAPVGPPFDNGGGATAIGILSGGGAVDYAGNRVYFSSRTRAGGSNHTLWALDIGAGGLTLAWSIALGDIDGSPVVRQGRVYVGNNAGVVHSVRAADGADVRSFATGDGPVKAFVFPDRNSTALYLSTTGTVWGLMDGASLTRLWPEVALPGPSTPLLAPGTTDLFVGSNNGRLYRLDLGAAGPGTPPVTSSVVLGDGSAAVGPPSYDPQNALVYVGSEAGYLYAVRPPF
jgi:outer membrane protein assembly factor BamB